MLQRFVFTTLFAIALGATAFAAENGPGQGNGYALVLAHRSPFVQSAMKFLLHEANQLRDQVLKHETLDAVSNPQTCVKHRANLTKEQKSEIIRQLREAGLICPDDEAAFIGGAQAGIFPPVLDEETVCPHLPQQFIAAPGSFFGGHHSYPGGLVVHEAFNEVNNLSVAADYRMTYGHVNEEGLPAIDLRGEARFGQPDADLGINQDLIIAAPIWHDWAKTIVFQWKADGSEFEEFNFGGNGRTDNFGEKGDARTPAHHILGLAESMKRNLSPELIIAQASAHAAPTVGDEYKVVDWIRAAAIVARADPVARGYLAHDSSGRLRLPPFASLGSFDLWSLSKSDGFFLAEDTMNNLSDANFRFAVPAVSQTTLILRKFAPTFGIDPDSPALFNNRLRNPVYSYLSAERLMFIYTKSGVAGVHAQLLHLHELGLI